MYLLIFMVTMSVANAVAIEKANHVSEVLLATVRPPALLLGKVIGVGVGRRSSPSPPARSPW